MIFLLYVVVLTTTVAFKDHQSTVAYKMALQLVVNMPSSFADVAEI